jgi:hypothetical protein
LDSGAPKTEEDLAIIAISSANEKNTAQIIITTQPDIYHCEDSADKDTLDMKEMEVEKEPTTSNDASAVDDLDSKSNEEEEEANEGNKLA